MNQSVQIQRQAVSMPWREARSGYVLRTGEGGPGAAWVDYRAVGGDTVHGQLKMIPAGNHIPERIALADIALLGVRGETDVVIDGVVHRLMQFDMILLKQGTAFSCANSGLENALVHFTVANADPAAQTAAKTAAGTASTKSEMVHHKWAEYRRNFHWTLPLAEQWGYHRGSGPYFATDGLRGHTVRQSPAQRTPWHFAPRDLLFMPVSGEVEFHCGGAVHALGPLDMLLIPGTMPYIYTNVSLGEVVFLSIGGRLVPGTKGRYFAEDPGWPVRPDARLLNTEIDPYGDAKVIA